MLDISSVEAADEKYLRQRVMESSVYCVLVSGTVEGSAVQKTF